MSFWDTLLDLMGTVKNKESKIGSLGEIAFEVSNYDRILTLDNYILDKGDKVYFTVNNELE